jgi:hypothetical protein
VRIWRISTEDIGTPPRHERVAEPLFIGAWFQVDRGAQADDSGNVRRLEPVRGEESGVARQKQRELRTRAVSHHDQAPRIAIPSLDVSRIECPARRSRENFDSAVLRMLNEYVMLPAAMHQKPDIPRHAQ